MLTLANGSSSTGLRQAVSLTHWAAETHIHETLRGCWEWRSTWKQHPCPSS